MLCPLSSQSGGAELVLVSGEDTEAQGGIVERGRAESGGLELCGPTPGPCLSSWPPGTRGQRRHERCARAGGSRSVYQAPLHTPGKARGQGSRPHLARVRVGKRPRVRGPVPVTALPLTGPWPRAATHPPKRRFLSCNMGYRADLTQWSQLTAEANPRCHPHRGR